MEAWRELAGRLLLDSKQGAIKRVLSGSVAAKWHPTGFVVFHLGTVEGGWRLRLHVWPAGKRQLLAGHPHIHNHTWTLASYVLYGTYVDTVYEINADGDHHISHSAETNKEDLTSIWPIDTVNLKVLERRTVRNSGLHYIPAGQLHETSIPLSKSLATLVLMGPTENHTELLLIGEDAFKIDGYVRPNPTPEEIVAVFSVLSEI